ncbi:MAG: hypothetical protein LBJ45_00215 [Holosporaceae bacterium]|jgi:hypothetical protein|nr:hypothetical protein [Holosporaceae bacterium]
MKKAIKAASVAIFASGLVAATENLMAMESAIVSKEYESNNGIGIEFNINIKLTKHFATPNDPYVMKIDDLKDDFKKKLYNLSLDTDEFWNGILSNDPSALFSVNCNLDDTDVCDQLIRKKPSILLELGSNKKSIADEITEYIGENVAKKLSLGEKGDVWAMSMMDNIIFLFSKVVTKNPVTPILSSDQFMKIGSPCFYLILWINAYCSTCYSQVLQSGDMNKNAIKNRLDNLWNIHVLFGKNNSFTAKKGKMAHENYIKNFYLIHNITL